MSLVVRLEADGWISRSTDLRSQLGVTTGNLLAVEIADGTIILHQAGRAARGDVPAGDRLADVESRISFSVTIDRPGTTHDHPICLRASAGGS